MDTNAGLALRKLVQCRICHDEDEASKMEAPCACCGSLKYAHRRCVQMWCNEKGDTVCEICQQQYKPGYSVPPARLPFAVIPLHSREPWEFQRSDQYNHPSIVAGLAAERSFFEHIFDNYQAPTASIICCRITAIIFMILLVLRHALPIMLDGIGEYSFTLYTLLVLRTIAILLPMCVLLKVCSIVRHHRRHRQSPAEFHFTSDEENEVVQPPVPAHIIHVQ